MEVEKVEPERVEKRKRWPSVRLNEIGRIGFAASSASLWLDAPKPPPRKKNSDAKPTTTMKKSNGGGLKAPRIRNLQHVGAKKKNLEDGEVVLRWGNGKVRGRQDGLSDSGRLEAENREEEADKEEQEEEYEARVSSDSRSGGAEESEERDAGANPGFRGEAMQGAIEDVAVDAGVGFKARTHPRRERERRSEEKGDRRRKNASMEIAVAEVNDLGFNDTTPSSSGQRIVSFSATLTAGVGGWLQELGLGKYTELFEVNEVDTEVLPLLTLDDLREMGVDAVGARRKMFCSIQGLGQRSGA